MQCVMLCHMCCTYHMCVAHIMCVMSYMLCDMWYDVWYVTCTTHMMWHNTYDTHISHTAHIICVMSYHMYHTLLVSHIVHNDITHMICAMCYVMSHVLHMSYVWCTCHMCMCYVICDHICYVICDMICVICDMTPHIWQVHHTYDVT